MSELKKILLNKISCKSIWFMRQAGRYLPEFRSIRSRNPNFINLCLNSELSSEITLQPIKRFDLDSAIIFSDILIVPHALGQNVTFIKDQGPKLDKFDIKYFSKINKQEFSSKLSPVYKGIEITRKKLNKNKSLIAFIGAPWTLLVYMYDLKKDKNQIDINKIENDNYNIDLFIEELVKYLCIHIKNQINAGADVVQIFDSWAGLIPDKDIEKYCYIPNSKIVNFCKKKNIPTICFPKGIKEKYEEFNIFVKPDGINIDAEIDPGWAKKKLTNVVLQGGLDPRILLKDDKKFLQKRQNTFKLLKICPMFLI